MRSVLTLAVASSLLLISGAASAHDDPTAEWEAPPPAPAEGEPGVDVSVGISAPGAAVTLDTFEEPLAAQGDWVTASNYGRVWRPRVDEGWRPYHYGRWEWTSEGWLWVSDEPFGWATYHYGRWTQDPSYGWVWIPGYQWAPAWVTWRYSPEYVGWAPLGPGFSVYVTSYPVVYPWWTFVPSGYFVGHPIHRHAFAPAHVPRIWRDTRPAPPRAVAFGHAAPAWGGPARGFVESRTGRPVNPVRVQPVASPRALRDTPRAGVVPVYRPEYRGGRPSAAVPSRGVEPRAIDRRETPRPAPPGRREGWSPGRAEQPHTASPAPAPRQHEGGRPQVIAPPQRFQGGQGAPAAPRYQGGERPSAPAYQPPPRAQPAPYVRQAPEVRQPPRAEPQASRGNGTPRAAPQPRHEQGGGGERTDHGRRGDRR